MSVDWESLLGVKKKEEKKEQPQPQPQPTPQLALPQPAQQIVEASKEVVPVAPPQIAPVKTEKPAITSIDELLRPEAKKEEATADELVEEVSQPAKEVWLIFGDKGTGKTTVSLSFPGELLVLSFDRKSAIIKHNMYNNDPRIHVFDVVKYMDYSSQEKMTESAERTFEYINFILDNYTKKYPQPDWIIIDGAQIFQQICEWTMRHRHNLGPFDGIANLNLWKERRMYIRQIHNKALNMAKRGIIYTTYVEKDEVIIKGEVVTRKDTPAWIDVLIYETDYVLYTSHDESKKTYHVRVVSSKNDRRVRSGAEFDVTSRRFSDFVNWT